MLYRAILGVIPLIFITLFATGAIPLSSVMPSGSAPTAGPIEMIRAVKAIEDAEESDTFSHVSGPTPKEEVRRRRERSAQLERMRATGAGDGEGWAPSDGAWGR